MSSLVLLGKGRLVHFPLSSLNCTHHLLKGSHDLGISVVAVRLLHEDALSLFCLVELFLQRLDGSSLSWNSLARAPLDCLCARAINREKGIPPRQKGVSICFRDDCYLQRNEQCVHRLLLVGGVMVRRGGGGGEVV